MGDKKQAEALVSTRNDLATLIKAVGTTPVDPPSPEVKYSNPNYQSNLPDKDRHTLLEMKGQTINTINNKLANGEELSKELNKKIEAIDNALDKLQYYNGEVVSDIRLTSKNPLDGLSVGDEWIPRKYLFSTKNKYYYKDAKYRLVINSKTGRDIGAKIDNYKLLKEVIFKRNTKFVITDIKIKKDVVYYYLDEVIN